MKLTRPQMLWRFWEYLEAAKIFDSERRMRLTTLYLERGLSRSMECDFNRWLKTNHVTEHTVVMRTRGSRLAYFSAWLNQYRRLASREERERLIRLYNGRALDRNIEREFHQFIREKILGDIAMRSQSDIG
jgi:hypothetical protein